MAILFEEKKKIFTLETKKTAYQMMVDQYGVLLHLYYGKKINGTAEHVLTYNDRGFSGNINDTGKDRTYSLDVLAQEYPTLGTGDYRNVALVVENSDGSVWCDLRYVSHTIKEGKYSLKGLPAVYASEREAQTLEILMEDAVSKVQVKLLYGVLPEEDIITRSAVVTNGGSGKIILQKAGSACVDLIYGQYDLISFYGRHAEERMTERTRIGHTTQKIGSRRGASSHHYNPAVVVAEQNATERAGNCMGMVFVYSGNFSFEAQKDSAGLTRAVIGLNEELFAYDLESGECFTVPETILSFSTEGLGELSRHFHRCIRRNVCRGKYKEALRPVLLNSWEASYFDFNADTIHNLAKEAAGLGIDMVVMDDGWFGQRNDDNTSLGDWEVNEEKLGCTLGELIEKVTEEGVLFGIWIEPEMVSEQSELYKKHPDWALQIPGRKPVRSRNQLLLDFSRKEVRDYIFDKICVALDMGKVSYVKWDMNRSMAEVFSHATLPGRVTYDYVLGLYEFLEKLITRYPDMLIEGCSGGGGRFDAGMLYYTPQIWCSDNTDAINRLKIQYGTSFFYPVSAMGSHVSAVPNHQTGRTVSMHTRGVVAMSGTFGYELDPAKLSEEEKEAVKEQIKTFKRLGELIRTGDYYRLSSPFTEPYTAWEFISEDKKHMLVNVVITEDYGNPEVLCIKPLGMLPEAVYTEKVTGKEYTGDVLMEAGIPIYPPMEEYPAYCLEFTCK
ncbi:MAG: alpha-galactosidase [Lachnospiraceae bacterium]|jgi:alpha-galactosidase|nr:alpha-galactosidase [Lachnospiraceae bacterium]